MSANSMDNLKWHLYHSEASLRRYRVLHAAAIADVSRLKEDLRTRIADVATLISSAPDHESRLNEIPRLKLMNMWKTAYVDACCARKRIAKQLCQAQTYCERTRGQEINFESIVEDLEKQIKKLAKEAKQRAKDAGSTPDPHPKVLTDDQQSVNKPTQKPAAPVQTFQSRVTEWYQHTTVVFANYQELSEFPVPPVHFQLCLQLACRQNPGALKPACKCSVRRAFEHVPNLDLKKERIRWHPDRFSACAEDVRGDFKKKAKEVFVVVEQMYQAQVSRS